MLIKSMSEKYRQYGCGDSKCPHRSQRAADKCRKRRQYKVKSSIFKALEEPSPSKTTAECV